jgi:hypothetical protein
MAKPYQRYSYPQEVYLSIDLDFWARSPISKVEREWLFKVLARADSVRCYEKHDEALEHINSSEIAGRGVELWNIDTHSDLAGWDSSLKAPPERNEGTWSDHVKWPHARRFLWIHPDPSAGRLHGRGRCEGFGPNPFRTNHPIWPVRQHCTRPRSLTDLDLPGRLIGACVILSENWFENGPAQAAGRNTFFAAEESYSWEQIHRPFLWARQTNAEAKC